jgi:hypothetical protein
MSKQKTITPRKFCIFAYLDPHKLLAYFHGKEKRTQKGAKDVSIVARLHFSIGISATRIRGEYRPVPSTANTPKGVTQRVALCLQEFMYQKLIYNDQLPFTVIF